MPIESTRITARIERAAKAETDKLLELLQSNIEPHAAGQGADRGGRGLDEADSRAPHQAARTVTRRWPVPSRHEPRRHPPRHVHHGRRAAERRLLHGHARPAAREEVREPGRPDRLPPVLRRRGGIARLRHHVLRVPGRRAGPRGRRDDPHRRLARRLGGGARVLARTAPAACRSRDPDGLRHDLVVEDVPDAPLVADHPEIPRELALQGFEGVRAYARDPARNTAFLDALGFVDGEARGDSARRLDPLRAGARRARHPRRRHRPPRRVGLDDGGARGVAPPRRGSRRAADAGHRPLLVPLDLLPRAERGAVRDRDARAGVRRRRGSRAPRRGAHPPAGVRAPARADRAGADAAARP